MRCNGERHSNSVAQLASGVQRAERSVALVGGVTQFDLSGTGTTGVIGLRSELSAKRWLFLEAGLMTFRPNE